ncbi:MAG TPA: DinB family protein [Flavipsychrobacter sp.]|nr:DinB family protein [Flavipsychrobacter sp.]
MEFSIENSVPILRNTPSVLRAMTKDLPDDWLYSNEGGDTWSVYDIVGHLLHGERTDWIARLEKVLSANDKEFVPFDRFAQFTESKDKSLAQLLDEFEEARNRNITILLLKNIGPELHNEEGIHPAFGKVKLSQLLATWTAHDLGHIGQIARVMAKQYKEAVGPWVAYLRILQS